MDRFLLMIVLSAVIIGTEGLQEKSSISSFSPVLQDTFNILLNQKKNIYTPSTFPQGEYTSILFAADANYDAFLRISDNVTRTFGVLELAGESEANKGPVVKQKELVVVSENSVGVFFSFSQSSEILPATGPNAVDPQFDYLEIDVGWNGFDSYNGVPGLPVSWVGNNTLDAIVNCSGYFVDGANNIYAAGCAIEELTDGRYTFTAVYDNGMYGAGILFVILALEVTENVPANPTTGTTGDPTTANPTTADPTTALNPTTADPTTADPTTASPTTASPTTGNPTTADPTTADPTTANPTTANPTTANPTTANPTTANPTTANPTTASPTTANPTTASPTTASPTTANPTTANPTTKSPTTASPTTASPTTANPTTANPTTANPTTSNPTTDNPTTTSDENVNDSSRTIVSLALVMMAIISVSLL